MKGLSLLLGLLLFTSCVTLDGKLETYQTVTLESTKGKVTIDAGHHDAKLKWKSKEKIRLTLTEGKNKKIDFSVPKDVRIPQRRGQMTLTAQQSGQPYDLFANLDTHTRRSPTRYDRESCTQTRRITRCTTNPQGERKCWEETVTYHGHREIRYHYVYTLKGLIVELKAPSSEEILAKFDGTDESSHKVTEYESPCHI